MLCVLLLSFSSLAYGQGGRANEVPRNSKVNAPDLINRPLDARSRFVYDVVRSAVALPQTEPQDRLRVLAAASSVISPIRPAMAKTYSREGLRVEQDLIQRGVQPSTSMLSVGPVDCKAVQTLIESIQPQSVQAAEPTLIAAVSACPGVLIAAQRLITAGLEQRILAPRATLALVERAGLTSPWSQQTFEHAFDSLPANPKKMQRESPDIAALYATSASASDPATARKSGLQLLLWLGQQDASGDRSIAVNTVTGAMKSALGEEEYKKALASDAIARQVASSAGSGGEISQPPEESASLQEVMQSPNADRLEQLESLAPSKRAREAAASGFASGTNGNPKLASRYFDLAFTSLNAVWNERQSAPDAPAVVQEVSEAAAQVNAMDALRRVRALDDTAAQAIGLIAIARVVASNDQATTATISQSHED